MPILPPHFFFDKARTKTVTFDNQDECLKLVGCIHLAFRNDNTPYLCHTLCCPCPRVGHGVKANLKITPYLKT